MIDWATLSGKVNLSPPPQNVLTGVPSSPSCPFNAMCTRSYSGIPAGKAKWLTSSCEALQTSIYQSSRRPSCCPLFPEGKLKSSAFSFSQCPDIIELRNVKGRKGVTLWIALSPSWHTFSSTSSYFGPTPFPHLIPVGSA